MVCFDGLLRKKPKHCPDDRHHAESRSDHAGRSDKQDDLALAQRTPLRSRPDGAGAALIPASAVNPTEALRFG